MPIIVDEAEKAALSLIFEKAIPVTCRLSKTDEERAQKECQDYINGKNKDVHNMLPISIYYIISELSSIDQIEFIKNNIEFIKEHDEEIFLYNMLAPKSLSYFLSLDVLKEIYILDKEIFNKIINGNSENLFESFNQEDYIEFYTIFYDEICKMDNRNFIENLCYHNRFYYSKNYANYNDAINIQRVYNIEFMNLILYKYNNKISEFTPKEILRFVGCIEDLKTFKSIIENNRDKLNFVFENDCKFVLGEFKPKKQELLITVLFDSIIEEEISRELLFLIDLSVIINLYEKHKNVFNKITLKDWIQLFCYKNKFNEEAIKILDSYELDSVCELFDNEFFANYFFKYNVQSLKYIENKYRKNIVTDGYIEEIDENTSIFSNIYLKNLKELRQLFKNNLITKNSDTYKKHLTNFITYLKENKIIDDIEGKNFKEIEKLFYRIIMGASLTILYEVRSIEEITIYNRLGSIEFDVSDFSIEQLENYNVKEHRKLCTKYENSIAYTRSYKTLILKLILIVGYRHTKEILNIDDSIPTLEHLVGNVDVKHIKLDEQGNPILNSKIINILFNNKISIENIINDKECDLYKYFPRIFNDWDIIKKNDKDKSLDIIIEFLKGDDVSLAPEYYRLKGLFKYIGCSKKIVNETLNLHDEILKRTESTIPKIKGTLGEYTYEILDLQDMSSLTVGNKTDCCFTVLGASYSCLKHACTSKNGRILVIKKGDQLIAHSWLWRNGNLLCLDNIEVAKSIKKIDFLDVYLKFSDEIIKKSQEKEEISIRNITIGHTNFDKDIIGIEDYPCYITADTPLNLIGKLGDNIRLVKNLPRPIEEVNYSDSKYAQYLIRGNWVFSSRHSNYLYKDEEQTKNKVLKKGTK